MLFNKDIAVLGNLPLTWIIQEALSYCLKKLRFLLGLLENTGITSVASDWRQGLLIMYYQHWRWGLKKHWTIIVVRALHTGIRVLTLCHVVSNIKRILFNKLGFLFLTNLVKSFKTLSNLWIYIRCQLLLPNVKLMQDRSEEFFGLVIAQPDEWVNLSVSLLPFPLLELVQ